MPLLLHRFEVKSLLSHPLHLPPDLTTILEVLSLARLVGAVHTFRVPHCMNVRTQYLGNLYIHAQAQLEYPVVIL